MRSTPLKISAVVAAATGVALGLFYAARTRRGPAPALGSQTNASEAIDDVHLAPDASAEEVLDAGVQQTFPASDPPAIQGAFETANEREGYEPPAPPRARRSPDWLLERP